MKLYYARNSRAVRVAWLFEELGLSYKIQKFDLGAQEMRSPEYKMLHPMKDYIKNYIIHNSNLLMNSAIILASGSGIRFGSKKPKQFTNLKNKMIVEHSIDIFYNNNNIDEIILVCPNKWQNNLGEKYKKLKFANGGETRLESSYIGLLESDSRCINVLIHDAATSG